MLNIIKKIVKILNRKKPIKYNFSKNENYDFIENGHIDSLALIKFIFDIEQEFKIKLSNSNISSKNFSNILGLAKIIKSKLK